MYLCHKAIFNASFIFGNVPIKMNVLNVILSPRRDLVVVRNVEVKVCLNFLVFRAVSRQNRLL